MPSGVYIRTEETKEKIRQSLLGYKQTDEHKRKVSLAKKGFKHTEESKLKIGLGHLGSKNNMWQGGRRKRQGYIWLLKPEHPYCDEMGYVAEHRFVMEQFLGRYIVSEEVVHHINKDITDNRIENLMLFANDAEHSRIHMKENRPYMHSGKKKSK